MECDKSPAEPVVNQTTVSGVSAVVCTRNRGVSIVETIETILTNDHPLFELIVVDQSADDITAASVEAFASDSRFRYIRTETKGLSRARNIGLREAKFPLVVFTDDDCTTPSNWLSTMARIFNENRDVAVAFCNVAAAPCDTKAGFIPAYWRDSSTILAGVEAKSKSRAIGAGMSVQRDIVLAMGGFDEQLGGGAEFAAAEDDDISVRALLKGYKVYETSEVSVVHFGFRTFEQGKQLGKTSWRGLGAAYSKPIKAGYKRSWHLATHEFFIVILGSLLRDVVSLRRPRGFSRITAFIRGFVDGWKTPVDRDTLCFRSTH